MKPLRITLVAAAIAVGVSACGSDDSHSDMSMATTASTTAATAAAGGTAAPAADFNDADVEFAQGMIPHHEQAIEMADIALDPTVGASEPVKALATRIKAAQDPEIQLMTGWLTAWSQPVQMSTDDGHDMASMDGMMSADEMTELGSASGPAFDTMWQEMMIRHHEGAIGMANAEIIDGSNAEAIALANQIVAAQQAEIDEMNAALAG